MEGNPYSAFVDLMHGCANEILPVGYRIGTVTSKSPLKVDIGGAVQERDALIFTSSAPSFEQGETLLMIPIENEQRYIILARLFGL